MGRRVVLADTSVWIQHFRTGLPRLATLLERGEVAMHPAVLGELACGGLADRAATLRHLRTLPRVAPVTDGEALSFLEARRLWGTGLGWIDVHLLAAARMADVTLWTLDQSLARAVAPSASPLTSRG